MLTLTENARTTVQELTDSAGLPETGGLRIAASTSEQGGFDLVLVAEPAPGDAVVELGTAKVFLEPTAAEVLADQQLDADPANATTSFRVVPQT
ncbi:adhesin [Pengzhenrongella frigida]|uniref:Adhesin n=1 Tax=Pengzhenrongella frigida TaxID=1259133 RepID=A0A4Q5N5P4_9MICO|nr:adhesin [Cellulomonas sp. HLT2-17]RYV51431.1 adhesin [Cellulomonas sp. HLT2-17]